MKLNQSIDYPTRYMANPVRIVEEMRNQRWFYLSKTIGAHKRGWDHWKKMYLEEYYHLCPPGRIQVRAALLSAWQGGLYWFEMLKR